MDAYRTARDLARCCGFGCGVRSSPRLLRGYGFHRDEFYIRESGRHLAYGYPDHPPLSPLLARIADELAPDSLLALRAPAAFGAAVTVLLVGLIAREFGGARLAQFLASGFAAGSILVLTSGHLLTTASIDVAFGTALVFVLARLIRTGDPRLWSVAGMVLGLGLLNRVFLAVERHADTPVRQPHRHLGRTLAADSPDRPTRPRTT
ncbi:ArnT family glycosyltransferase [Nocardia higoensis]|uniref:ArnT family glycosyltransferase n=1 Tax=Nocardia higoensis TaxID=228599 RepID=UPI000A0142DE